MAWVVTLEITDCATSDKLTGAFVTDGYTTAYSDAYGQVFVWIDDAWSSYGLEIGKLGGYLTRTFVVTRQMEGTTQTVCLNAIADDDDDGGGTSDGW